MYIYIYICNYIYNLFIYFVFIYFRKTNNAVTHDVQ